MSAHTATAEQTTRRIVLYLDAEGVTLTPSQQEQIAARVTDSLSEAQIRVLTEILSTLRLFADSQERTNTTLTSIEAPLRALTAERDMEHQERTAVIEHRRLLLQKAVIPTVATLAAALSAFLTAAATFYFTTGA